MVRKIILVALLFVAGCASPTTPDKKQPPPPLDKTPWQPTVDTTIVVYSP